MLHKIYLLTILTLASCLFIGCGAKKTSHHVNIKQEIIDAEKRRSLVKRSQTPIFNLNISKIEQLYGYRAMLRALDLNKLINSLHEVNESEKVAKINIYFNRFEYLSDMDLWGVKDYWATRDEFIGKGAGDCEDFVIAKYFTLNQLGIPTNKLYFTYVKALFQKEAHMVLTYYKTPDSIPLVLDSLKDEILPATQRKDLIPIYSFNGESLFISKRTGLMQMVPSGNERNEKWKKLINKMEEEKK